MKVTRRTVPDNDGGQRHVINYDDEDADMDKVVIRHPPGDPDTMVCYGYVNDELVYERIFETRDLSFSPISILGRGESEKMLGVTESSRHITLHVDENDAGVGNRSVGKGSTDVGGDADEKGSATSEGGSDSDEERLIEDVPESVRVAFNAIGLAIVPEGEDWIDEHWR